MPLMRIEYDHDFRRIVKLERDLLRQVGVGARRTMEALKADIRANWSPPPPPSAVGDAPAVRTGNLDSSIFIDSVRDVRGRFAKASDNFVAVEMTIDTEKGKDPQGRGQYAVAVEELNFRPFVEPAVDRISDLFDDIMGGSINL